MKLTTIWTLPTLSFRERLLRTEDWANRKTATLIPARVRYWVFIQVGSKAMDKNAIVPDALFMDLLKNAEGAPRA